jgi:N-methylhydantoinase B
MTHRRLPRRSISRCKLTVETTILADLGRHLRVDKKGINVPLVYTKAYVCFALKCAIAPDIPNNAASLAPFEVIAPENSIVNAPAPGAGRAAPRHRPHDP